MGWRGTLRAIEAEHRRAQRDAQRRFKELQRQSKENAKLSALEQARLEVETHENRIELLLSIHKGQGKDWDWHEVQNTPPPLEPIRGDRHASEVDARLAGYMPGFLDKLFGRGKKHIEALEVELYKAKDRDEREFQEALAQYRSDRDEWDNEQKLASSVIAGDPEGYARVLRELSPFEELSELGSSLSFRIHTPRLLEALVKVTGERAIPSEIKSLTSSGKVSTKAMPKARFHEIYQDYVCGCVLRVAREVLALLPIETAIVTALADLFDSRTGRTTEQPILSVTISRAVMNGLNFDLLDPSDAMENFLHRGDFKAARKSGAFVPITPLSPTDLEAPQITSAPWKATFAATPPSVSPSVNPFPAKWAEALRRNEIQHGFLRLTANELAQLVGRGAQDNFTLPESKILARTVESFGYCLEPDPRNGAGNFWGARELGVFQPPSGRLQTPSESFLGASGLLQLCLLVAAADGTVDPSELDQFRRFIETQFRFTPDEHQRLVVLETLLGRNATAAKVTLGRAAKRVPQEKHILIAQFLVDVAGADGVISPAEQKALTRIFEALGLSIETLDTLIRSVTETRGEVVIQSADAARPGEPISAPPGGALKLDMARVAAISAETHEVIGLLARAMAEGEADDAPLEPPSTVPGHRPILAQVKHPASCAALPVAALTSGVESLSAKYRPVFQRLTTKGSWSRAEFDALASEHRLMPLDLFDGVNEWADEHLGDFILEGEDPITVRSSLLTD